MKVERFIVGRFAVPYGIIRRDEELEEMVTLPVPAYVIETENARILVDTGLHPVAARDPAARYGSREAVGPFEPAPEKSIAEQVDLATIKHVVLTHLHWDHAGGLELLPDSAPVVVQRREWEAAHDPALIGQNFFLPIDYESIEDRVVLVDGDHDLFGDGSVELLFTPGHTSGHQSVRIGRRLVLAADVVHFEGGLDDQRFPVFAADFEAQRASAERLKALRDGGATVIPGHDPDVLTPGVIAGGPG
jgi:N-acyl homoserine lactone hydrolase